MGCEVLEIANNQECRSSEEDERCYRQTETCKASHGLDLNP